MNSDCASFAEERLTDLYCDGVPRSEFFVPPWIAILAATFLAIFARWWILDVFLGFVASFYLPWQDFLFSFGVFLLIRSMRPLIRVSLGGGKNPKVQYEKLPVLVPENFHGGHVYDVPGDGFCGVHSLFALVPEFNYLQNLSYFRNANSMASCYRNIVANVTKLLLQSPDVIGADLYDKFGQEEIKYGAKISPYLDQDFTKLHRWIYSDLKNFPDVLCDETIHLYAKLINFSVAVFDRADFIRLEKTFEGDRCILLQNAHFEPWFRKKIDSSKSHGVYIDAFTAAVQKIKNANIHFRHFDFSSANALALLEGKEYPVCYTEKASFSKEKTFGPPTPETPKSKPEEVKVVPDDVVSTGIDSRGKMHYSVRYKNSPRLDDLVGRTSIAYAKDNNEGYHHPFLRTISNWFYLSSWQQAFKSSSKTIIDVGSKYHHVVNWLAKAPKNKKIILARPEVNEFDVSYNKLHADSFSHKAIIERNSNHHLSSLWKPHHTDAFYILNDVMYYPDVIEGLRNTTGPIEGMSNMIVYPHKAGVYKYHDKEGKYTVTKDGFVISIPEGNPSKYTHPLQMQKTHESYSILRKDGSCIRFVPILIESVGLEASMVKYHFFDSENYEPYIYTGLVEDSPSYTIPLIKPTYRVRLERLVNSKHVVNTKIVNLVEDTVSYKPSQVLYDLLAPHIRLTNMINDAEKEFASAVYMSKTKFASGYSHEDVVLTILCIYQDLRNAETILQQALLHPKNAHTRAWNFEGNSDALSFSALLYVVGCIAALFTKTMLGAYLFDWQHLLQIGNPFEISLTIFSTVIWLLSEAVMAIMILSRALPAYFMPHIASTHEHFGNFANKFWVSFFFGSYRRILFGGRIGSFLPSIHYDVSSTNRLYYPMGNVYGLVKRKAKALLCACKPVYQYVVDSHKTGINFGSCPINLESAIFTRQFNAMQFPDPLHFAGFEAFVHKKIEAFKENLPILLERAKLDYSFEIFLKDSCPRKRKAYAKAWENIHNGNFSEKLEFFSKSNEVHYDDPNARPRNIASFSKEFTVSSAYLARLMIPVVKKFEPGFVSGCNLKSLGKKLSKAKAIGSLNDPFWFMGDGSGFDASQHYLFIKIIDNVMGPAMANAMAPHLELPSFMLQKIIKSIFADSYTAVSRKGDKIEVKGTVLSGHGTRTTLFNTLRSLWYQQYCMQVLGVNAYVFASGDDILGKADRKIDYEAYKKILSDKPFGRHGLGILIKDFKQGNLHELDFLSKGFMTDGFTVEAYRLASKCEKSGISSNSISKAMPISLFCRMQAIQMEDLPKQLSEYVIRFWNNASTSLTQRAIDILKFDWAYRLYVDLSPKNLVYEYFFFNPVFIRPVLRGGSSGAHQIMKTRNAPVNKISVQRIDPKNTKKSIQSSKVAIKSKKAKNQSQISKMKNYSDKLDYGSRLNKHELDYARSLIDPFSSARHKIPNIYPIETSTMSWHSQMDFRTTATGFAQVLFQPWNPILTLASIPVDSAQEQARFANDSVNGESLATLIFGVQSGTRTQQQLTESGYAIRGSAMYKNISTDDTPVEYGSAVNRYRIVNAGIKIVNVSPATARSGALTIGHTLADPRECSIEQFRQLATSFTTNMDDEQMAVYVPHDPACYDFYFLEATSVWETNDPTPVATSVYKWIGYTANNPYIFPSDPDFVSDQPISRDLMYNSNYVCISGAPNQDFSVVYAINLEIVPNKETYTYLQPAADCRGSPVKAQEALVCAEDGDTMWTKMGGALKSTGGAILRELGSEIVSNLPKLLAALAI